MYCNIYIDCISFDNWTIDLTFLHDTASRRLRRTDSLYYHFLSLSWLSLSLSLSSSSSLISLSIFPSLSSLLFLSFLFCFFFLDGLQNLQNLLWVYQNDIYKLNRITSIYCWWTIKIFFIEMWWTETLNCLSSTCLLWKETSILVSLIFFLFLFLSSPKIDLSS